MIAINTRIPKNEERAMVATRMKPSIKYALNVAAASLRISRAELIETIAMKHLDLEYTQEAK